MRALVRTRPRVVYVLSSLEDETNFDEKFSNFRVLFTLLGRRGEEERRRRR